MNVQSNQIYVAAMQSAITTQEPTAVSVLKDTSLQQMGRLVLVSFTFLKNAALLAFRLWLISESQKRASRMCTDF